VTKQAPVLHHQGVHKRNLVMDQLPVGVHENTGDTSDDEAIPTPPAHQGISKWGQVTGWTNTDTHPFTGELTGKRQNVALHINKA
jgi:hypothetical protein